MDELSVYEKQKFGQPLGFGKRPALLVVDFVNGFVDPEIFGGGNIPDAVRATVPLLEAARRRGLPVAFTRIVYADDGADAGVWCRKAPRLRELTEAAPASHVVDDLKPGDVAVFACGGSTRIAPWGSLLSTATTVRGAAGCVTDGFVRDILEIRRLKLPVFHGGIAPLDSKGRGQIQAVDVPVLCGGVRVAPGDLVFGDADGVVVVPQAVEADVLKVAFDKINGESHSMRELQAGGFLRDVYAKYGVL